MGYNDHQDFDKHGGLKSMGDALERGMVFVMSLWDDHYAHMLWLDAIYPLMFPRTHPVLCEDPAPRMEVTLMLLRRSTQMPASSSQILRSDPSAASTLISNMENASKHVLTKK